MKGSMVYKEIHLQQLRAFCLVASQENFAQTAKALGLSRPTVWQQVRALERELGAVLLRRHGRGVKLTPEGRLLLELVQPHVSGLDSLARVFETRRAELQQNLTVSSTHYLLSYHLSKPVEEFTAGHGNTRLFLRACLWPEVLQQVEHGQADLGVIPFIPDEPRSPHLDYQPIFELRFTLVTSPRHPLARKKRVVPADLVQYPLILGPPEGYDRKVLERILQRHDLAGRLHVVMESHSLDVIRKYVALGIGITVAHLGKDIQRQLPDLHFQPFDAGLEGLPVAIVVRKGAHLPGPVQEFVRALTTHLRPHAKFGRD